MKRLLPSLPLCVWRGESTSLNYLEERFFEVLFCFLAEVVESEVGIFFFLAEVVETEVFSLVTSIRSCFGLSLP